MMILMRRLTALAPVAAVGRLFARRPPQAPPRRRQRCPLQLMTRRHPERMVALAGPHSSTLQSSFRGAGKTRPGRTVLRVEGKGAVAMFGFLPSALHATRAGKHARERVLRLQPAADDLGYQGVSS